MYEIKWFLLKNVTFFTNVKPIRIYFLIVVQFRIWDFTYFQKYVILWNFFVCHHVTSLLRHSFHYITKFIYRSTLLEYYMYRKNTLYTSSNNAGFNVHFLNICQVRQVRTGSDPSKRFRSGSKYDYCHILLIKFRRRVISVQFNSWKQKFYFSRLYYSAHTEANPCCNCNQPYSEANFVSVFRRACDL